MNAEERVVIDTFEVREELIIRVKRQFWWWLTYELI